MNYSRQGGSPKGVTSFVKAVSFDVTGTLIHSPRMAQIYSQLWNRHGLNRPEAEVERALRTAWVEFECAQVAGHNRFGEDARSAEAFWGRLIHRVAVHLEVEEPSPFLVRELYSAFEQSVSWAIFPDVVPVLTELRELGYRMIALANWDERLPRLLEELELAAFFEHVVYSQSVGVEKPSTRIFSEAQQVLGLQPAQIIHVGDRQRIDVEGAVAASWTGVLIDRSRRDNLFSVLGPHVSGLTLEWP